MASASANKKGQFSVQFTLHKKRLTIYLGKVDKRWAEEFARHVDRLVDAFRFREPASRKTQQWLAELAPEFRAKLASHQLVQSIPVGTIAELCAYEIENAKGQKPKTVVKYRDAEASLVKFFGSDRLLHQITPGDAESFRRWMLKHGSRKPKPNGPLAETTTDVRCKQARQFFATAVKHQWLDQNPFSDLTLGSTENPDAQEYVGVDIVEQLFRHASPQMQLFIACSRFGGIRVMSELRVLRWEWVNFSEQTVTVKAPKNERYKHKKWRVVPMYDCWRPYLEAAFEAAPEGAEYVMHADR
ncbi:MAG: tyrosine-type recombinase/integrase, partial [Granulosicoccaceae bacterium]